MSQGDLFAGIKVPERSAPDRPGYPRAAATPLTKEAATILRTRLNATLALVRAAEDMPWDDHLAIIREDNAFRFAAAALPPEEGAPLWAEFDAHMNRLYAVMNARLAADPRLADAAD